MKNLIPTINQIIQFGLSSSLEVADKEKLLEQNLVRLYSLYFDIAFEYDDAGYPDVDRSGLQDIRSHVQSNFPDFGLYYEMTAISDWDSAKVRPVGDAIDDLSDIIRDLMEIKWRYENNSPANGLWYFQLIFPVHTRDHLLGLLKYLVLLQYAEVEDWPGGR